MRKVYAGFFHSVDGVVEGPDKWQFDSFDEELGGMLGALMARTDAVLLGRVGYEAWASYWPNASADMDFARFINAVPKHVASRTLRPADIVWSNAALIEGDVEAFVSDLKAKPGGDIGVMGGVTLARRLFFAGLLDSLTFITHPVVAGAGDRFFRPGDPQTRLRLEESVRTSRGNVVSTYALRPE